MFFEKLNCIDIFVIFETCFIEFLPEIAVTDCYSLKLLQQLPAVLTQVKL